MPQLNNSVLPTDLFSPSVITCTFEAVINRVASQVPIDHLYVSSLALLGYPLSDFCAFKLN